MGHAVGLRSGSPLRRSVHALFVLCCADLLHTVHHTAVCWTRLRSVPLQITKFEQ